MPLSLFKYKDLKTIDFHDTSFIFYKNIHEQENQAEYFLTSHLIAFVLKGEKIVNSDNNKYTIKSGNSIFIQKGLYILSEPKIIKDKFESLLFFLDDNIIKEFLNSQNIELSQNRNSTPIFKLETNNNLKIFILSMQNYFCSEKKINKNLFKLKIFELLYILINNDQKHNFKNFLCKIHNKPDKDISVFMKNNFCKTLNLEDYAYLTGKSLSTFKREFKNIYNQTPGKWLKNKRLEKAKYLLLNTNLSVTDICYNVGYENISNFIKSFKEIYGTTPKQFLRK